MRRASVGAEPTCTQANGAGACVSSAVGLFIVKDAARELEPESPDRTGLPHLNLAVALDAGGLE